MQEFNEKSFFNLMEYIEKENFQGFDPYDTLNSFIPFKNLGKWPAAIVTQIQKRNPFNIRPLIGIKKGINPKAFGLFLQAFSILYKITKKEEYLLKANYFFEWLNNNYTRGYSGKCWGYNFPWSNPVHYYEPYVPSSVVTSFVIRGIWEYYLITNSEKAKEAIISSSIFILNDILVTEEKDGICFSYTPLQKDLCYNSSLLAAEILSITYRITKNDDLKSKSSLAVNWVIKHQKENGKWNYSIDPITIKERDQVDFHQGFILESIFNIKTHLGIDNTIWEISLTKGLKFYKEKQFFNNGVSLWRLPNRYPVDIHNQAQGIITFINLNKYYPNSIEFAAKIAEWTRNNMQAKSGFFYYKNYKYFKHKIPYMRWSNAWMFLALTLMKTNSYENQKN